MSAMLASPALVRAEDHEFKVSHLQEAVLSVGVGGNRTKMASRRVKRELRTQSSIRQQKKKKVV